MMMNKQCHIFYHFSSWIVLPKLFPRSERCSWKVRPRSSALPRLKLWPATPLWSSLVLLSVRIIIPLNHYQQLILLLNIEAGVGDAVRAEWSIQWESNADGRIEKKQESESRDGELKNVTILAQVEFKRLSSIQRGQVKWKVFSCQYIPGLVYTTFVSKVSVSLKILINDKNTETEFLLHSGTDAPIILIAVFSSLGGVLLILSIIILIIKRRRRRLRLDTVGDHHHSQSPLPRAQVFSGDNTGLEDDDWSSVDLNSPGHNNSNFFNGGFTV